jgi:hypothetical protein
MLNKTKEELLDACDWHEDIDSIPLHPSGILELPQIAIVDGVTVTHEVGVAMAMGIVDVPVIVQAMAQV